MTPEEFVRGIQKAVFESSIEGTMSLLLSPPGRKPSPSLVEKSKWFNELEGSDREQVRAIIQMAVHQAVFGMLTILDNVRTISNSGEMGKIELRYVSGGNSVLVNSPSLEMLHDLYVSRVPAGDALRAC